MSSPETLSQIGEFGLIERLRRMMGSAAGVVKGIGDDAAVVRLSAKTWGLWTTDLLLEGVHFTPQTKPKDIGRKALACSLSDIAAMGGVPRHALVSLGISGKTHWRFVRDLYLGMKAAARPWAVAIIGGDTVQSDKLIVNVALWGEVAASRLVTRSGARVEDHLYVTGSLGNSLRSGHHLKFTPRLKESQFLVRNFRPTAMIDVSDGLLADLGHILKASRVGAVVEEDRLPLRRGATVQQALSDGEDFELLFTLSSENSRRLSRLSAGRRPFRFTRIGTIVPQARGLRLQSLRSGDGSLRPATTQGYQHFS